MGPEFTASANGLVSIRLYWDVQTPNRDLDLTIIDKATGAAVWPGSPPNPVTGNEELAEFTVSGLSYGQSKTYQVKVQAKALGSNYGLSGSYPAWDTLSKLELLNSSNAVVASTTPPTSGTASATLSASSLPAGAYTIKATSGGSRSTGTLTETHQAQAFADVTVALKNSSGTTIASDRKASGTAGFTTSVPTAGSYTVTVTDNSTDLAVPSYSLVATLPRQHLPSVTLVLKNASGTIVAAATGSAPTISHAATRGGYTLVVTPFTGVGTAALSASYPSATMEAIAYDGRDHATSIDDGLTKVVETLAPSGRVIRRVVLDSVTGATREDLLYGYDDDGDSPAYTKSAAGEVTTYVEGPLGLLAIVTGTAPSYPLTTGHGDIAGTTDAAGAFTAAPWTDEFGVGPPAAKGLGWLGSQQRQVANEALGLIRMGVRLYDPRLGRFLGVDPVEGGSANDYDYCSADPLNCFDLAGTYSYSYSYDVTAAGSAEEIMNRLVANFGAFPIPGCRLVAGSECGLKTGGYHNPVRVESVGATSFTFRSLPGHFEGANKQITFSFATRGNTTSLTVTAQGKDNLWQKVPLARRGNRAFANRTWGQFAANLRDGGRRGWLPARGPVMYA